MPSRQGAIDTFQTYQGFMGRLSLAVNQQQGAVAHAARRADAARQVVREHELRVASVRKLIERRLAELRIAADRRDQKQTDEFASRAAWNRLAAQQALNSRLSAELTAYVRHYEPAGITVSIGGEIGEVGTENSTPEELRAYMDGYNRALQALAQKEGRAVPGLSKISVQSGTTHGGTVLPDGSIADVAIDFETLRTLSQIARDEYGMSGAVQHGASTLPQSAFGNFPRVETAEIHLATNFQNIAYDHLPSDLRDRMYDHCRQNFPDERKAGDTEEQFIYKARKKALGAFKRELWELPEGERERIRGVLNDDERRTSGTARRTTSPSRRRVRPARC